MTPKKRSNVDEPQPPQRMKIECSVCSLPCTMNATTGRYAHDGGEPEDGHVPAPRAVAN